MKTPYLISTIILWGALATPVHPQSTRVGFCPAPDVREASLTIRVSPVPEHVPVLKAQLIRLGYPKSIFVCRLPSDPMTYNIIQVSFYSQKDLNKFLTFCQKHDLKVEYFN